MDKELMADGYLDLHADVKRDNQAVVFAKIRSEGFVDFNRIDAEGNTILHIAVDKGYKEIAFEILKHHCGINVNAINGNGDTALHICAKLGHLSIAARILDCPGLNVNRKDFEGRTALYVAIERGHVEIVKEILAIENVDVNVVDDNLCTPFQLLETDGLISKLIREDRAVNWVLYLDCRRLHRAIRCEVESEVVDLMARSDMMLHTCDFFGTTTLHIAIEHGKNDIVQAILERDDVSVNGKDCDHNTPLHLAIYKGNVDMVRVIIAREDVDVHAKDHEDNTPLHLAIFADNYHIVEALLHKRVVVEQGALLLHLAIECCEQDLIPIQRMLVGLEGINLLEEDENGQTAFEIAFIANSQDVVKIFMEQPAVKEYVESLYRDRQVYVDAANAILVGAALIASVTFASWLQPPLGYSTYYGESYVEPFASPPISYPQYVSIDRHKPLEAFWVFNSFSFFFAIATVVFGARSVLPNRKTFIKDAVRKIRQNLLITSILLSISVMFVLIAFGLAGYVVLPPIMKFQANIIGTVVTGGIVCLVSLFFLAKSIYDEWTA